MPAHIIPSIMHDSSDKPDKAPITEKFWLLMLVFFVFLTRIFFLDMGFGRPDAWRVAVTGKFWVELGEYFPSRPPGFPLVEMLSALSYSIFHGAPATWIMTNALTSIIFCVSVAGVWALARKWGVKSPLLLAAVYAFVPLNWVYSVETIDYLWMTAFLVMSVLAIESDSKWAPLWAGVLLGFAVSARFFAVFQLIPLLILMWTKRKSIRDLLLFTISFTVVALGSYTVVFLQIEDWSDYIDWYNEITTLRAGLAEIEGGTFVKRFLIPAVCLFGPLATIGLIGAGLWGIPKLYKKLRDRDRGVWGAVIIAFFIMAPYIWHLHPNYWIPAIGFLLILLARTVNTRLFVIVGILIIAANFPWWQSHVEGFGFLKPYKNETVFVEMKERYEIMASVDEFISQDHPSDWVIMPNLRLPIVQYLIPDIQRIDLTLVDGSSISVWGSSRGGPKYKYDLSPYDIGRLIESGYYVIWFPGMERTYYATYGVQIHEVEGVKILFRE